MPCPDPQRYLVPVASDAERPVQDARWNHPGAPGEIRPPLSTAATRPPLSPDGAAVAAHLEWELFRDRVRFFCGGRSLVRRLAAAKITGNARSRQRTLAVFREVDRR